LWIDTAGNGTRMDSEKKSDLRFRRIQEASGCCLEPSALLHIWYRIKALIFLKPLHLQLELMLYRLNIDKSITQLICCSENRIHFVKPFVPAVHFHPSLANLNFAHFIHCIKEARGEILNIVIKSRFKPVVLSILDI
jgi:hypothetical protein